MSLPPGAFVNPGAGVKTNLLFFTRGKPTERIWYYDLSHMESSRLLPGRADGPHSWTVTRDTIDAKNYDLKAVNPNARADEDLRTPEDLLDLIEAKGREVAEALRALRAVTTPPHPALSPGGGEGGQQAT